MQSVVVPALEHSQEAIPWQGNWCKSDLMCIGMVQEDATEHIAAVLTRIKPEYLVCLPCVPLHRDPAYGSHPAKLAADTRTSLGAPLLMV